jgi:uncharacterized delta-60 repeat protein
VQADGKLVLVGDTHDGFRRLCFVIRQTTTGALDPSFAGDGKLTFVFPDQPLACSLRSVLVQNDGRIVVAGGDRIGRLTSSGAWDTSFAGDGRAAIGVAGGTSARDLALAVDGKLWVGGGISQLGQERLGLLRLNTNGSLDTSFSGDGWTTFSFNGLDQQIARIVPLADGRVLALGSAAELGPLVTRFLASGAVEGNFGVGGKVILDAVPSFHQSPAGLLVQPDGKIVAVTNAIDGLGVGRIAVWRLTASGAFDPGFDGDGVRVLQPLVGSAAGALLRQSDGKLIVAGRGAEPGQAGCLLLRLNSGGALDAGYGGGDGWVLHQPGFLCRITDASFAPGSNTVLATGFDTLVAPVPGLDRGDGTPYDFLALRILPR